MNLLKIINFTLFSVFLTMTHATSGESLPFSIKEKYKQIIVCKTMQDVATKINEILVTYNPAEVLVAFDINKTLTWFDHPILHHTAQKKLLKKWEKFSDEEKDKLNALLGYFIPQYLIEDSTPLIIKSLQGKGIKVIAFTATPVSALPSKKISLQEKYFKILNKFGINFESSFGKVNVHLNKDHPTTNMPIFHKGILCANGKYAELKKGEAFVTFLKIANYSPKIVFLIDDKRNNLEDVAQSLQKFDPNILFIGIEYQGLYFSDPRGFSNSPISEKDLQNFWEDLKERGRNLE